MVVPEGAISAVHTVQCTVARNLPVQFVLPRQILKINQQVTTVQEFMFSRVLYVGGGPTVQRFYNLDSQEKKIHKLF